MIFPRRKASVGERERLQEARKRINTYEPSYWICRPERNSLASCPDTAKGEYSAEHVEEILDNPEIPMTPKNPNATLEKLPTELLLNTVGHLNDRWFGGRPFDGDDRHDDSLAALVLTNRHFSAVAEERIYSALLCFCEYNSPCTRAVAASPRLAKYVKQLALRLLSYDHACLEEHYSFATRDQQKSILLHAQNLQELKIFERYSSSAVPICATGIFNAMPQSAGRPNSFCALKRMELHATEISSSAIQGILQLPALEYLKLTFWQPEPYEEWEVSEASNNVHILELHVQRESARNIGRAHWRSNMLGAAILEDLENAMRKHKDSLEDFFLNSDDPWGPDNLFVGTLGSFLDFSKLNTLQAPLEAPLNLEAGKRNLARVLPRQLKLFGTAIESRLYDEDAFERVPANYRTAIESIAEVITGPKMVGIYIGPYLPFDLLGLSQPLNFLLQAGADLELFQQGLDTLSLDALRDLEVEDAADTSSNEESGEESDEEWVEYSDEEFELEEFAGEPDQTLEVLHGQAEAGLVSEANLDTREV